MTDIQTVTIKRSEYERLIRRNDWLECLEAAGVDNWQGMEEAIAIKNENKESQE